MLNCLEKVSQTPVWQLCDSCQIIHLINFQNNLTLPNSSTAWIGLAIIGWYTVKLLTGMQKLSIHLVFVQKASHCQVSSILSGIFCDINAREYFNGPAAFQQGMLGVWLSDDQPHSDYNGQWQKALFMIAVRQSSQPNPYRNKKR